MKLYIGADHRGYELKEKLFSWLIEKDYLVEDCGAYEYDETDDFVIFAEKVASLTANDEKSFGILLCGSGVGVDVAANKFDGVRASIGIEVDQVRAGRNDDDMNILVIASDYTDFEKAKDMVTTFLKTDFSGKSRYNRRLEEIKRIEENN